MKTAENSRELLDLYFQDIASSKPLTSEREIELAEQIREGDQDARNSLVAANLRYVVRVAGEYRGCGMSMEDLIGSGNLGLITAAERFDPDRGVRFITYATWWIRHAIQRSLSYDSRTVRLPTNKLRLLHSISAASRRLGHSHQSEPGAHDIADSLNLSVDKVRNVLMHGQETMSLDAAAPDTDRADWMQNLPNPEEDTDAPDNQVSQESDRQEIDSILGTLGEREAMVLRMSYGLDGEEPMTLEEIGKKMKVTKERIRQIRERAFTKLRHPRRRVRLDLLRHTM